MTTIMENDKGSHHETCSGDCQEKGQPVRDFQTAIHHIPHRQEREYGIYDLPGAAPPVWNRIAGNNSLPANIGILFGHLFSFGNLDHALPPVRKLYRTLLLYSQVANRRLISDEAFYIDLVQAPGGENPKAAMWKRMRKGAELVGEKTYNVEKKAI